MRALRLKAFGGTDVLEIADVPEPPAPQDDQIIVRVRAAGVNRADTLQRRGLYPAPPGSPPDILGMEFAGEVSAVGPDVRDLRIGDRVMGLLGGGAQAEFVATREPLVLRVPDAVSDVEAGGIPEAYITAHDALFSHASLVEGERVLIHAVGSGVGLAAVQLAKAAGAVTFGSARSPAKAARAKELGLDHIVNPRSLEFPTVDIVIDFVGADYLQRNVACLATLGRLVFVSTLSGPRSELDISMLMRKRLRLAGTMMRNRDGNEKVRATKAFSSMLPFFADRHIVVPIDRALPLEQAEAAHAALEANENFGKIVLTL
jgi:putative PIG3 family NAD(P)H quinone oxidoreductase